MKRCASVDFISSFMLYVKNVRMGKKVVKHNDDHFDFEGSIRCMKPRRIYCNDCKYILPSVRRLPSCVRF